MKILPATVTTASWMVPGTIRDPCTWCYQRPHGRFLLEMLSNDDLLPATSEFLPSFPRSTFPSRAAAANCADRADLGLDTGVTLFMSFLLVPFTHFYFLPVAELLLVSITGEEKRGQSQEGCPGAHRWGPIPYFHFPAETLSLAASMPGMELTLIYP